VREAPAHPHLPRQAAGEAAAGQRRHEPNVPGCRQQGEAACFLAPQRSALPPFSGSRPRCPLKPLGRLPPPGILAAREMSGASGSSFPLLVVLSSRRQFGGKQLVSSFRCRPASASSSHPAPDPRVCDTSALPAESRPLRRRFFCRQGGRISFGASCFQTLQQQVDQAAASFPAGNSR